MPGFDGTGPLGKGPMTGNGKGHCIVKIDKENPEKIEGYSGVQGQNYPGEIIDLKSGKEEIIGSDKDMVNLLKEGGVIMPRGDGTGPAGSGPMTGRAAGYCAGYPVPGYMNPVSGQGLRGYGFGRGRGFSGRGRGRGFSGRGRGRGFSGRGRGRGRGMGFRTMRLTPYYGYPYPISGMAPYSAPYSY
ncbi:MAG: DUF5320 domain-containing protein [Spirochaetales bacterium]|nr:DUF5320 domain-containing protein [Spirochaetales bacterium]